ncbi:hypothetical protein P7K49_039764 [Saguinus oedipus]|uniref:Uncharacterized protein n=1 Tax=Saguinus oedipus TaxID=9490 RepID=A0ABQ9TB37_SAGOE|nr:hypothetical protein P7K49_039764 [Saguinus oedipus]
MSKPSYCQKLLLLFRYMREYCFKGLFEIPPHKAFPHFPFNTRVELCKLKAETDNHSSVLLIAYTPIHLGMS